jgi:hypothetical protein
VRERVGVKEGVGVRVGSQKGERPGAAQRRSSEAGKPVVYERRALWERRSIPTRWVKRSPVVVGRRQPVGLAPGRWPCFSMALAGHGGARLRQRLCKVGSSARWLLVWCGGRWAGGVPESATYRTTVVLVVKWWWALVVLSLW